MSAEPAQHPDVRLIVQTGSQKGMEIPLSPAEVAVVGSNPTCTLSVTDARLAVRQFQVEANDGRFYLRPLSATPTLFVNGIQVNSRCVLETGYVIEAGLLRLLFQQTYDPAPSTASTSPTAAAGEGEKQRGPRTTTRLPRAKEGKSTKVIKVYPESDEPPARVRRRTPSDEPPDPEAATSSGERVPADAGATFTGESPHEQYAFAQRGAMLKAISGPIAGQSFGLDTAVAFVVGRAVDADLVFADHAVSRRHCRLSWEGEILSIDDLDSANGTYVNGVRVARVALQPGDVIGVGEIRAVIVEGQAPTRSDSHRRLQPTAGPHAGGSARGRVQAALGELHPLLQRIAEAIAAVEEAASSGGTDPDDETDGAERAQLEQQLAAEKSRADAAEARGRILEIQFDAETQRAAVAETRARDLELEFAAARESIVTAGARTRDLEEDVESERNRVRALEAEVSRLRGRLGE